MREEGKVMKKRSAWVWLIAIFFSFSSVWTFISLLIVNTGLIAVPPEQKAYIKSLTAVDYSITILISLANLAGAISLLMLRKMAFPFFLAGFAANLLLTLWHILTKGWGQTMGGPGSGGTIIGWLMLIAVSCYVWKLVKNKTLT